MNPLNIRPGVNTEATPMLNEGGWSVSNLIRFFGGLLQKLGGWQRLCSTALVGTGREILPWADLSLNPYVAVGTEQRLQVLYSGNIYDITPIRKTDNLSAGFTTTNGSAVVTVTDTAHGATTGDWVNVIDVTYVGGVLLSGFYLITVTDANHYTITAATNATSGTTGGTTALFTTTNASNSVKVTLTGHGLSVGAVYTVGVSTTVGGLVLSGQYIVQTVIDSNNFTIQTVSGATSSTSGSENGGLTQMQYLLPSGLASTTGSAGWGEGGWGLGAWGIGGTSGATTPLRQWSLGAWGYFLIASPTNLGMYVWDPTQGVINNPSTTLTNAPTYNTGFFIAMPQRQIVGYGCTDAGTGNQDPMLVRFCDVDNFTSWTATVTNQAGSYRLPRGSKIVGGLQGPQFGVLWTDLALWQMMYIQPPLVYGFNEIAAGCGLIAKRACGILGGLIFWMSQQCFFVYDGNTVRMIPCSVWDIIYQNLYALERDKITCAPNSLFGEVAWYFPSLTGSGENDTYVKLNPTDLSNPIWDYGTLTRTAWVNQSIYGAPMGVDGNGLIQQHETAYDADGAAMAATATSGWLKLDNGGLYIFLERMIPDFKFIGNATVNITIYTADYPTDTPNVYGSYAVTSATKYLIVRSRSRLARIQISSSDIGTFWRLGEILHNGKEAGKR